MVRTKADGGSRKAVAAKAPRKVLGSSSAGSSSNSGSSPHVKSGGGGNSVVVRPTPEWQKGMAAFLTTSSKSEKENQKPANTGECATPSASSSSLECSQQSSLPGSSKPDSLPSSPNQSPYKTGFQKNGTISDDEDDE